MEKKELEGKLLLAEESNRVLRLAIQRGINEADLGTSDRSGSSAGIGQSARADSRKRLSAEPEDDFFELQGNVASIPTQAEYGLLRLSNYGACLLSVMSASSVDENQFSRSDNSVAS